MTLTLNLPPEVEARLQSVAQAQGLDLEEVAAQLLQTYLSAVTRESLANRGIPSQRYPAFVAVVKSIRGKFAHTAPGRATDALHQERQTDKAREEHRGQGNKA